MKRGRELRIRRGVGEELGVDDAKGLERSVLVQDAHARDAADEDVVATVVTLHVMDDDAGAGDVEHGRATLVVRLEPRFQAGDGQGLLPARASRTMWR